MPKTYGCASIVLLMGTSSAGKTTIIKEIKTQNKSKLLCDQLDWQEDGIDLEERRQKNNQIEAYKKLIDNDSESTDLFNQVNAVIINSTFILKTIAAGSLCVNDQKIPLVGNHDIDTFILKLSEQEQEIYTQKTIGHLQLLTTKHHEPFKTCLFQPFSKRMQNMFDRAMENSKNGKPTILDIVPLNLLRYGGYDVISGFTQYLQDQNFSCPTYIALAHCNIGYIVKHMDKRNACGDPDEIRDRFLPLEEYGSMYHAINSEDQTVIGEASIQDIVLAANKYGSNRGQVLLYQNDKDANQLVQALRIPHDYPIDKAIKITTAMPYDRVYQTRIAEENPTTSIAKEINRLATTNSLMPLEAHPVTRLIALNPFNFFISKSVALKKCDNSQSSLQGISNRVSV